MAFKKRSWNMVIPTNSGPLLGKEYIFRLIKNIGLWVRILYMGKRPFHVKLSIRDLTALPDEKIAPEEGLLSILKGTHKPGPDLSPYTDFQKKVLKKTMEIPFGETLSYKELAESLGTAPRPVGQALRCNRTPLFIPCHRVVGSDGGLGGFSQGLQVKSMLLRFEIARSDGKCSM